MTLEEINQQIHLADEKIASLSPASFTSGSGDKWWSVTDAMTISAVVLAFGLLVILLSAYLIRSGKHTEDVLRIFGTILIIVMAVFLVVAGYTDKQIAPVMGLLGTIVGYLLGKETKGPSS